MGTLNGVKTLDMVNGEITKVEYDGAEYVKVNDRVLVGDIGRFEDGRVLAGDFDIVVDFDEDEDPIMLKTGVWYRNTFDYFRKVGASSDGYRLVTNRKPKAGDFVKFIATNDDDVTIGNYYKVHGIDCDGDLVIYDDNGDESCAIYGDEKFELYEKVTEPKVESLNDGDYVKVISAGQYGGVDVGEYGRIVPGHGGPNEYRVDKLDGSDHDYFYAENLEKVTEEEAAVPKLKVGDYAKVVNNDGANPKIPQGTIVEITESIGIIGYSYRVIHGEYVGYLGESYRHRLARATEEEVAEAKLSAHKASFKNGDYAKLLSTNGALSGFTSGEIVKITDVNNSGRYEFEVENSSIIGFTNADNLERVSEEEARNAKRPKVGDKVRAVKDVWVETGDIGEVLEDDGGNHMPLLVRFELVDDDFWVDVDEVEIMLDGENALAEEDARWVKIGRKPNEFKQGDIVMTHDTVNGHQGVIGEVVTGSNDGRGRPFVTARYTDGQEMCLYSKSTLVTPVEARFDR